MKLGSWCLILVLVITCFGYADIIHVPGDQPTIQSGIDVAVPGDEVQVAAGTYRENITLTIGVSVMGAGADVTRIVADSGSVVTADNVGSEVIFSGFAIDGQWTSSRGISCVRGSSPTISNNIITHSTWGIISTDSSPIIVNNTIIYLLEVGLRCEASSPVVRDNVISHVGLDAIWSGNGSIAIINNNIMGAAGAGIKCWGAGGAFIEDNEITESTYGIENRNTSFTVIRRNTIKDNFHYGIFISGYSRPDIGTESEPGLNEIFNNGYFDVYSEHTIEISAKLNWWGEDAPNPDQFYGSIDYTPWLTEPPTFGQYPLIFGVSPNFGTLGTRVAIIGNHFADGATVMFGINPAIDVAFVSETKLKATTPSGVAGAVNVIVSNPDGKSATLENGFFYVDCGIPGDVSGDGVISAYDAALILQYLVGLIDQFPATSPIGQAAQKYIAGDITIAELDRMLQSFGYPSVFKMLGYENQLLQNYPNPFNPETWIPFKLAHDAPVTISIYNTKGQLLRTITLGDKQAGIYTTKDKAVYWNGKDNLGQKVSSGVYYYTLQAGEFKATRRMVIVK